MPALRRTVPEQLTILFFSTARVAAGRARLTYEVPVGGKAVREVLRELSNMFPGLGPILPTSRLLRNGAYLRGDRGRVRPGDEFAIHPPYSGG